jgi:hypothetical protein
MNPATPTGHKITIPENATAAFPVGWEVEIYNASRDTNDTNRCEVAVAAGVSVGWGEQGGNSTTAQGDRLRVRNNNGLVRLVKVNANTWQAFGDTRKV